MDFKVEGGATRHTYSTALCDSSQAALDNRRASVATLHTQVDVHCRAHLSATTAMPSEGETTLSASVDHVHATPTAKKYTIDKLERAMMPDASRVDDWKL